MFRSFTSICFISEVLGLVIFMIFKLLRGLAFGINSVTRLTLIFSFNNLRFDVDDNPEKVDFSIMMAYYWAKSVDYAWYDFFTNLFLLINKFFNVANYELFYFFFDKTLYNLCYYVNVFFSRFFFFISIFGLL